MIVSHCDIVWVPRYPDGLTPNDLQWFTIVAGKSGGQDKGRADVLLTLQRPVKRKLTLHRPGLLGSDHSYGEAVASGKGCKAAGFVESQIL